MPLCKKELSLINIGVYVHQFISELRRPACHPVVSMTRGLFRGLLDLHVHLTSWEYDVLVSMTRGLFRDLLDVPFLI
jgi:hypothetical protein